MRKCCKLASSGGCSFGQRLRVQVGGGRRREGGGGVRELLQMAKCKCGGIATDEHVKVESHGMQQHTQHAAALLDDPHLDEKSRKGRSPYHVQICCNISVLFSTRHLTAKSNRSITGGVPRRSLIKCRCTLNKAAGASRVCNVLVRNQLSFVKACTGFPENKKFHATLHAPAP